MPKLDQIYLKHDQVWYSRSRERFPTDAVPPIPAHVWNYTATGGKRHHPRLPRTTSPPRGKFAHEHSTQHRQQRCGALPFSGAAVHCAEPGWRAYSHGAGMHVGGRCTYRRQQGRSAEPRVPAQLEVAFAQSESASPTAPAPSCPPRAGPPACRTCRFVDPSRP